VSGLVKTYGDAIALRRADISLDGGEVHGLIGENGAGKSTLVKALSGMITPDSGEVHIAGEPLRLGNLAASRNAGIRTAFQELTLLPNLTVAENLLIDELPTTAGIIRKKNLVARASEVLERWDVHDIDPRMIAGQLPLSAQQRLEIVRALDPEPRILILDEPTAALPDTEWIFKHIRSATARGAVVLYISHKLAEMEELCDRGTIMRNGRIVGDFTRGFDHDVVISEMIGRSIEVAFPPAIKEFDKTAAPMLEVEDLSVDEQLRGVSLTVRPGEILGIAALEGQGQKQLFYAIAGATHHTSGDVKLGGEPARLKTPRTALRSGPGVALVPEERKTEGLFADMTSMQNISAPILGKISGGGFLRPGVERKITEQAATENYMRHDYLYRQVGRLSGGNQQKAVLARISLSGADVRLMFDPTRGIDPAAKLEVYKTLRESSAAGIATLLYSTEIPELIGMCDRILVMYQGQIVAELTGEEMEEEKVMAYAVGRQTQGPEVDA
jgi:ribose transport system ATP-binding protein